MPVPSTTVLADTSGTPPVSSRRGSLELLGNLTMREIRAQFKRTMLGRLWSIINPLATIGIYSLVFGFFLRGNPAPGTRSGIDVFALWLAAGLIPWNFINAGVVGGMNSLLSNAGLLSKVYFPRWILVISQNLAAVYTFLTELGILLVVMAIAGGPRVLLFIPVLLLMVAVTAAFCAGIALMLSVLLVYFRDTQHFIALGMQIWFYLTPIIYPLTLVKAQQQELLDKHHTHVPLETIWGLNPAYRLTSMYRSVLYDFDWPHWQDVVGSTASAAVVLLLGILVFRKYSARVVEEL